MRKKAALPLSLTVVFAALYAVGVVVLAPISFQIFQVRVADALLPLAILFGWPSIVGFALGAFIANFFGGLGIVDIIGGSAANLVATYTAWRIGRTNGNRRWLIAVAAEILTVTVVVGSYLSYLLDMPLEVSLLGIFLGSFVAIGLLGYPLLIALSKPTIANQLKAHGLTIYSERPRAASTQHHKHVPIAVAQVDSSPFVKDS